MKLLFVLAIATGCSTLKVETERVKSVKSVAVVGYTAVWEASQQSSGNDNPVGARTNAIRSITKHATGEAQAEREERALATYDLLVDTLKQKLSWTVLDRDALGQSGPYREKVEARPHATGGLFSPSNRFLFVDGVLKHEDVYRMGADERRALMDALQVDALAHVYIRFNTVESGFAVGGIGNRRTHPVATVEFYLYDRNTDEPIWSERFAKGRRAEKMMSQNIAGVAVERETIEAVVEAASYGYEEMIDRYQQYQP